MRKSSIEALILVTELFASDIWTVTMNQRRGTIATIMRVVVVVALNLTVGRMIFEIEPWRLAGIGPIAVTIQVGLFFLIRARGRSRHSAFWAGYEAGSLLGLWSFLYVRVPNSRVGSLWEDYGELIDGYIRSHFGFSALNRSPLDPILLVTVAVFAFLPQFLMGLGGGLMSLSLAWSQRIRTLTLTLTATFGFLTLHLALWLYAWQALPAQPPWLLYGVTPGGLMLELGLIGLIRSWNRLRAGAFWMGLLAIGSLVVWSYLHAMVFIELPVARYYNYWPDGPWYAVPIPESTMWKLWIDYTSLVSYFLGRPPYGTYIVAWTDNTIDAVVYSLIIFLPHLLSAVAGGILARRVVIISQRWFDHQSADNEVADGSHASRADP